MKILCVIITLLAAPASAQTLEKVADYTSTGLVGVNMALDAVHAGKHHCWTNFLVKNGISIGGAEGLKRVVHEERPNHLDNKSWPSEHSWLAAANTGWNFKMQFSIALGAGAGRVISEMHHPLDVVSGLFFGSVVQLGVNHFFPCSE